MKKIILSLSIALASTTSMAQVNSTPSTLINFTSDQYGVLFSTSWRGDSPCRQSWGNEYRIPLSHPNFEGLSRKLLAISFDAENTPFTFTYQRRSQQGLTATECSNIDGISRFIGE